MGRLGRDLMVRRDAAMALNLKDPRSGMDYFTAAQQVIRAADAAGGNFRAIAPIPYWENLWPGAAGGGMTATQVVAEQFVDVWGPDYISALWAMDQLCDPSCSILGPFAFFNRQYDSLAILSTIGHSNYNALQLSLRKGYAGGTQFDLNYTLSKSDDLGSLVERGSAFGNFAAGGYSGFLLNSWEPELHYGTSDFDLRHQFNANGLLELPFGQGRRFGGGVNGFTNALIGDWSIAGLMRLTSGFPFNVYNCRSCWPTNWNLQGNAMLVDPNRQPETKTTKNAVDNRPSPFENPTEALLLPARAARRSRRPEHLPRRRLLHIDASLSKAFSLFGDNKHRFRWDVFNVTNTREVQRGRPEQFPDRTRLRPVRRHARDLRRAGRTLHAVRAAVRILGGRQ